MKRLLGPNHNRLLIVDSGVDDINGKGHITQDTADELNIAGWKYYDGPAESVGGWITPGSDPNLRPWAVSR